jgi:spore coat protein CotH
MKKYFFIFSLMLCAELMTANCGQADSCISITDNLALNMCVTYKNTQYGVVLSFYPNPADTSGAYWKMEPSGFKQLSDDSLSCQTIDSDLGLNICAEYKGTRYRFQLDKYSNSSDSGGLYWKANLNTFMAAAITAESSRPAGWQEETHGDKADPNYDAVFQEGAVLRMDITIAASDWQTMLADMTSIYGEFGKSGGMGNGQVKPDNGQVPGGQMPAGGQVPAGKGQMPADGQVPGNGQQIPGNGQVPAGGDMGGGMLGLGDTSNPMWMRCNLTFNGKQWNHVGIRFKGNSSLTSTWGSGIYKLPFRLDFEEFDDLYPEIKNQRFYGFKKLSLSSGFSDDSLIREKVAADIFRDAGVPAPRTAFYRLYIDYGEGAKYFGLYTMVEIPDKPMLKTQFGKSGGNLYKPETSFASYSEASFDKESNADKGDFSDVLALYNALQADRSNAALWRAGLESTLNVDGFLKWLAVNTVIQNWDTYGQMAHNYYLYNNPDNNLLNWIPWDNNMALSSKSGGTPLSLSLSEVGTNWPLIRYLMDDSVYKSIYTAYVQKTVANVFNPTRMQAIYTAAHELIRPYVVGTDGEVTGYTNLKSTAAFDTELDYLNTHVQSRYDEAIKFVSGN